MKDLKTFMIFLSTLLCAEAVSEIDEMTPTYNEIKIQYINHLLKHPDQS